MKYIDLHSHSTFSDGTFTPKEIVELAIKQDLRAVALTDHDTVKGLDEFMSYGKLHNLETIPGVEFSTNAKNGLEIHVLGLFLDYNSPLLINMLDIIEENRFNRNMQIIEKFKRLNIYIDYDELHENSKDTVVTRSHYANYLVKKGIIKERSDAFKHYIGNDKPCYVEKKFFHAKECIETIKKVGGVSVLAHPTLYKLDKNEIFLLSKELKEYGLTGIETFYSSYKNDQTKLIKNIADRLDLAYSGGSDFHGANRPSVNLGIGKGNLNINYTVLEKLKKGIKK